MFTSDHTHHRHPKLANAVNYLTVRHLINPVDPDNFAGFLFDLAGQLAEESNRRGPISAERFDQNSISIFRTVDQRN